MGVGGDELDAAEPPRYEAAKKGQPDRPVLCGTDVSGDRGRPFRLRALRGKILWDWP